MISRFPSTPFRLKFRAMLLILYLRMVGVRCGIQSHYRTPEIAHQWSTAYSVINGKITLDDLRQLPQGCDKNRNLWFKPEWAKEGKNHEPANKYPIIVANARKYGPRIAVYAEEGYEADDPRRSPNLKDLPVSKHVTGHAIDLNVDWKSLGGARCEHANSLIACFGLCRPVSTEAWHFELGKTQNIKRYRCFSLLLISFWYALIRWFKRGLR